MNYIYKKSITNIKKDLKIKYYNYFNNDNICNINFSFKKFGSK